MLASWDANEEATNKATRLPMPLTQGIRDVGVYADAMRRKPRHCMRVKRASIPRVALYTPQVNHGTCIASCRSLNPI